MEERYDIAFVASGDPNIDTFEQIQSGGTGPIWQLAREFEDGGHDVTIYSGTYETVQRRTVSGIEIIELPTPNLADLSNLVLDAVPFLNRVGKTEELSTSPGSAVERLFGRLMFSKRAAAAVERDGTDIVYLRDRISAFFPARGTVPSVFTVTSPDACDFFYDSSVSRHPANRFLFWYKQYIEESVLSNVDQTIVMNDGIKKYFREKDFSNINKCTLSVEESVLVDLSSRTESPRILYVGRLDGNKRPDWVVDAFLAADTDDFKLHMIGSGPRKETLEERVVDSSRQNDISFCGQIPRSEVLHQMRKAAVFILPSRFENCPNVIVEAMASGCPVIASGTMGARELVTDGKTGILFNRKSKEALTTALDSLVESESRRRELAQAAYKYVRTNHTDHIIANKYLNIGLNAINQQTRGDKL